MRTRSQSRNLNRQQQQAPSAFVEPFNLEEPIENPAPPVVTMDDTRIMAQLLEAPTEGYKDAIVVPEITADNFELKHGLLTFVQNKQFFAHDKEDPHAHIRYFNKITSTMKFPNVPSTSVKLMLFPFSLEGATQIWLEKEPPRSILTWDDLVSKFINKFFPPSKTTNLRNEITRFQQRFDETFYEAWDRFNDLLRACPHHGFSELHQLDTFYNALNSNDQDSLNSAAGVSSSSSTLGFSPDVAELKDMVKALLLDKKNQTQAPAPVKAVEESCVTCGGAHSYRNCPATDGNVYRENIQETPLNEHCSAVLLKKLPEKLGDPGKFLIPCDFPGNWYECLALADLGASINLMPLSVWKKLSLLKLTPTCMTLELADWSISCSIGIAEDVYESRTFLKTGRALIDVYEGELTLRVGKEAVTFNIDQTSRYSSNYDDNSVNRIDVIDMVCEEYSQEVLGFSDVIASGNPTPYYDPIVSSSSPTLTPFGDSDFLLEEVDAFPALEDDPTSAEVDHSYSDSEGDILFLEAFLNDDPSLPLHSRENYLLKFKTELKVL
ncbi:reverse transcriptase domain-containing protein [Tanacetum coccineum]